MRLLAIGAMLALASPALLRGQAGGGSAALPRVGLVAGVNLATLKTSDIDFDNRTGLMIGGMASLPIGTNFAIQPEVLFTMKGAALASSDVTGTTKINYLEVPVLLRFDVPVSGAVRPFFYAGPSVAVRVSCAGEARSGSTTVSSDCGDAGPRRFDAGAVVGGGLAFDVGGRTLAISARYDVGLVKLAEDVDVKNRVLSFVGTFEWPLHR